MHNYRFNYINAQNVIAFVSLKTKIYYNGKHQPRFHKIGDLVNFELHRGYQLPTIKHPKIGFQFAGPFKIIERIGKLAYRLDFPNNMKIHDVISLAHFEPAIKFRYDPYRRYRPFTPAVVIDNQKWSTQYFANWVKIRTRMGPVNPGTRFG